MTQGALGEKERSYMIVKDINDYASLIYLCTYYNHFKRFGKAASIIKKVIIKHQSILKANIASIVVNELELSVFNKFDNLMSVLLYDEKSNVDKIFVSTDDITLLISRISDDFLARDTTKLVKLVLAICNQINYEDINITIPKINISTDSRTGDFILFFGQQRTNFGFKIDFESVKNTSDLFVNLFKFISFPADYDDTTGYVDLCRIVHIPMMPDVVTGFNISHFCIIDILANITDHTKRAILESNFYIFDIHLINTEVIDKLVKLSKSGEIKAVSSIKIGMEASNDNIEEETPEAKPEDKPADEPKDEPAEKTSDEPPSSDSLEGTPPESTPPADDPAEETGTETPISDDPNNAQIITDKTENILGVSFELAPPNEKLEDIMYKISVCSFIENLSINNEQNYDSTTIALLRDWKSLFLFFASAKETKKMLSSLKVSFK